jgi:hypothetical protein
MERYVFRCFLKKDFSYTIINNYHLRLLGQRQGKCRRHRLRKEQGKGFFCWQPPAVHLVQYNVVDHEGNSLHKLDEPKNTEFSGLKRPKPLPSRSYAFAKQNCCQRTSTGLSSMVWVVPCGVPWWLAESWNLLGCLASPHPDLRTWLTKSSWSSLPRIFRISLRRRCPWRERSNTSHPRQIQELEAEKMGFPKMGVASIQWPFQEPKLEVPTIYTAYVRIYPHKIWPYMVQYLHFRILEFPLIKSL